MNRYYFSYRISGTDYWGDSIQESLGVSRHEIDATTYDQAEQELRRLFPDRLHVNIVEHTVLTDIDALRLLEDVNKRIESTVFKDEREFLQALRKRIQEDTPLPELKIWIEEIQARTDSPRVFSSVHCCSTELLNQFFTEENQIA